jgi:CubicO group peptidase (beta-lactamase class C family)
MRHSFLLLIFLTLSISSRLMAQHTAMYVSDSVKASVRARVDNGYNYGIIVGVVDPGGTYYYGYGKGSATGDSLTERTVFEIGSATKAFTGILLAQMAEQGDVRLSDPISRYIPRSALVPTYTRDSITLLELATHTSGLPRLPTNLNPADDANPYADYSVQDLYAFLAGVKLGPKKYEYSNVGMGLLGHILAHHAGVSYEELLRQRVLDPLGLRDTRITLSAEQQQRLAHGHSGTNEVPNWDIPTLAGAGALRSTAADMLRFLAANMGIIETSLNPVLRISHEPRASVAQQMQVGLGWHIRSVGESRVVWHNGGTGGYRSFIGFDPKKQVGVVVLTNSDYGADDIGIHILDPAAELERIRPVVAVDSAILNRYVGSYQLAPTFILTVTREGNQMFVQATGQPRLLLRASSDSTFFLTDVEADISFSGGEAGPAKSLTLHQNGASQVAQRIK